MLGLGFVLSSPILFFGTTLEPTCDVAPSHFFPFGTEVGDRRHDETTNDWDSLTAISAFQMDSTAYNTIVSFYHQSPWKNNNICTLMYPKSQLLKRQTLLWWFCIPCPALPACSITYVESINQGIPPAIWWLHPMDDNEANTPRSACSCRLYIDAMGPSELYSKWHLICWKDSADFQSECRLTLCGISESVSKSWE